MFPEIHVLREASGKDVRIAVAVIVVVVFFDGTARPAHCVMVPLKVEVVGFCCPVGAFSTNVLGCAVTCTVLWREALFPVG